MLFDQQWFQQHQTRLLWWLNLPWLGKCLQRYLAQGPRQTNHYGRRVVGVLPGSIHYRGNRRGEYRADFWTGPKMSMQLHRKFLWLWHLFHIWDTWIANSWVPEWNLGFDSLTVYTGAGSVATFDGRINSRSTVDWATARSGGGTLVAVHTATVLICQGVYDTTLSEYQMARAWLHFDTSPLTSSATVTDAYLGLWLSTSVDVGATDKFSLVASTIAAGNTSVVTGDFSSIGSTKYATDIDIATWSTLAYVDWQLNSTGFSNISLTSYTRLAMRSEHDMSNVTPVEASDEHYAELYSADYSSGSRAPRLSITYTLPIGDFFSAG